MVFDNRPSVYRLFEARRPSTATQSHMTEIESRTGPNDLEKFQSEQSSSRKRQRPTGICSFPGCGKPVRIKGQCKNHYQAQYRHLNKKPESHFIHPSLPSATESRKRRTLMAERGYLGCFAEMNPEAFQRYRELIQVDHHA